jgi:hypothetical protein
MDIGQMSNVWRALSVLAIVLLQLLPAGSHNITPTTRISGIFWANAFGQLDSIEYSKMTHISWNGIGFESSTDPRPTLTGDLVTMRRVRNKAHAAGIPCLVQLIAGGWNSSWTSLTGIVKFVDIVDDSQLRDAACSAIATFVVNERMDGVNVDWEGESTEITPSRYNALLASLRTALPSTKLVTICGMADLDTWTWFDTTSATYVDWYEVMMYSLDNMRQMGNLDDFFTDANRWIAAGYPRTKIDFGIPLEVADASSVMISGYKQVIASYDPPTSVNSANTTMIKGWHGESVYVDGGTIWWNGYDLAARKTQWCLDNGIGGVMLFAIDMDACRNNKSILRSVYNTIHAADWNHPQQPLPTTNSHPPASQHGLFNASQTQTSLPLR